MSIQKDLEKARQKVTILLEQGHIAKVEEVYRGGLLSEVNIHHYPLCPQCVKERKEADGKERKI